jgi:hypothetical protein
MMNAMVTSATSPDTAAGLRVKAARTGKTLLRRLLEFHSEGTRTQYVIWDRLCDFGDDQSTARPPVRGH